MAFTAAVIFDMDGLMFDTEALARDGWLMIGKQQGLPITQEIIEKVIGMNAVLVKQTCHDHFGCDFEFDRFRTAVSVYMKDWFDKNGMPVKPGLPELLVYLKENGYRTAVASSSSLVTVEHHLRKAKITEYFDVLVCGDMVVKSKPEPDIFLKAAELLQVPPGQCMALEDSYNGIRSAHAAGMKAVMIPDLVLPNDEITSLAFTICESLFDVIPLLSSESEWEENL